MRIWVILILNETATLYYFYDVLWIWRRRGRCCCWEVGYYVFKFKKMFWNLKTSGFLRKHFFHFEFVAEPLNLTHKYSFVSKNNFILWWLSVIKWIDSHMQWKISSNWKAQWILLRSSKLKKISNRIIFCYFSSIKFSVFPQEWNHFVFRSEECMTIPCYTRNTEYNHCPKALLFVVTNDYSSTMLLVTAFSLYDYWLWFFLKWNRLKKHHLIWNSLY